MTTTKHRATSGLSRRDVVVVVTLLVTTGVAALYTLDPGGVGRVSFDVVAAAAILGTGAGPLWRGARPRPVWAWTTAGSVFFLLGLAFRRSGVDVGPIPLAYAFYLSGYGCYCAWMAALTRLVGRRMAVRALLDAATTMTGFVLLLWTLVESNGAAGSDGVLRHAIFPIADVVALALAAHLVFRLGWVARAWWWVFAGLLSGFLLDLVWMVSSLMGTVGPRLTPLYLFPYVFLALAATHPSVVRLSRPRPRRLAATRIRLRALWVAVAVLPAVVAMSLPLRTTSSGTMRSVLVGALLLVLFARLLLTMGDLARAEAVSRFEATHDRLTGVFNRAALIEHLRGREARGRESGPVAVLFLDCDDFKRVNDTWGHGAGDALLRSIATGLSAHVREGDVVARNGGDEFVVVASVDDVAGAAAIAARVERFFAEPIRIAPNRSFLVTPSIGVVMACPGDGQTPADLLGKADIALYEAKARGGSRHVLYDDRVHSRALERAALADALQAAVASDRLTVAFQPIMSSPGGGRIAGWEALARWTDRVHGTVSPEVFIPLAESLGLIHELGESVLRRACGEVARLRRRPGYEDAFVSVNVSVSQLRQASFDAVVAEALTSAGLPGEALWLEITESLVMDTEEVVLDAVAAVRRRGITVCLDDFGTGYASVSVLLRLHVDCVKLDKTLTARLDRVPDAPHQLRVLLTMLTALGIEKVVAEGVETAFHDESLRAIGTPYVQGWWYGRAESPGHWASHTAPGS